MATEIERKFLVTSDAWRSLAVSSQRLVQGYVARGGGTAVRVRMAGDAANINFKEEIGGTRRLEFEYPVPLADAREMLSKLALPTPIEKVRHLVPWGELTIEVDEFYGANAGLIVAEVELPSEDYSFVLPVWFGQEVSNDRRYYNTDLSAHPYTTW